MSLIKICLRMKLQVSPLPRVYCKFYPHLRSITVAYVPISAGIPPLLSPLPRELLWYYHTPHPHVTLW